MEHPVGRQESPLVSALFGALDLACDHGDIEIIRRLSQLLDRLAAQGGTHRPQPRDSGAAG